jgi:2-keto-4-pentenoate hydratase/2-oxohepta-3-ene-1,7-dioic acid hydratase in catechol pathway
LRISSIIVGGRPALALRTPAGLVNASAILPEVGTSLRAFLEGGDLTLAALAGWAGAAYAVAPLPPADVTFRPLVPDPSKIMCLGLNYLAHARESAHERPQHPVVFARVPSSLTAHEGPLLLPACSEQLDYEAELAVVIGRRGRRIPEARALEHVAGYTLFNDGTIRDYQRRTPQWTLGKNFDATGALGPELVTPDELPEGAKGLRIRMRVSGETMQDASTSDMIYGVAEIIAHVSEVMTLEPGDVIAMGTPSGVGVARTPPRFLRAGDVCEVDIEKIGVLRSVVVKSE